jgi:AAA+ ATPase superfamily predicted ATPase
MYHATFIGCGRELAILQNEWEADQSRMLILYGRRHLGKTCLITHWINSTTPRALYWVAEPTSQAGQLRSFSQTLFGLESNSPVPEDFSYASWGQAFEQASRMAKSERLALVPDEFTYLVALEEGIAGILQNVWDHHLKQSNIFLIISGSHVGMMERGGLSYQAPLYGRATMYQAQVDLSSTMTFVPPGISTVTSPGSYGT